MTGPTTVRWFAVVQAKSLKSRMSRLLRGGSRRLVQVIENIVRWLRGGAPPIPPLTTAPPLRGVRVVITKLLGSALSHA